MARTVPAHNDPPPMAVDCQEAVDRLLARHGWRLLEREELARRAEGHLRAGNATDPIRAATHAYCLALHAACAGGEGRERQELGYAELFRYLYDGARRRHPDVAAEVAQDALERVYLAFGRCRQPGAFLAFALQHLLDAARATFREGERRGRSLAAPAGEAGGETVGDRLPDPRQPDPAEVALAGERQLRLARLREAFLRQRPRAAAQFDALWLKYVEGLDDAAIGRRLGKPVARVHELRSRAITTLRSKPEWRAFARECGIMDSRTCAAATRAGEVQDRAGAGAIAGE